jgi:hypothetical protein
MSARWNALYDGYAAQVLTQLASDHDTSQDAAFGAGFMRRLKDWQKTSSPEAARILVAQFLDQVYPSALPRNPDVARWLFKAYLGHRHNGRPILAEDLYKLRDDIAYFDKVKKSQAFSHNGDQADLLQYKSYDGLMQTLRRYRAARQLRDDARAAFHVTTEQLEIIVK